MQPLGRSFQGAFAYYFHDNNADTSERIAWTETLNMLTDCVDKAWKVMTYTAKSSRNLKIASGQRLSGAKLEKPVLTYSLAWHPEQKPDRKTMMKAVKDSLKKLGLSDHQAAVSCHIDEPQPHIHVIVNTVHPLTGLVAKLKYTKRKFSDFARIFQREEGTMYCPKREENYQKRQRGQKTNYVNPVFMEAWKSSPNGRTFFDRLQAKGYYPAQGRGRIVVVDERGKPINPKRHLPDVDNKTYKERLADLAPEKLPTVEELAKAMREARAKHNKRLQRHDQRHGEAMGELEDRQSQERDQTRDDIRAAMETKRSDLQEKYRVHDFKRVIRKIDREIKGTGFWGRLLRTDKRKQAKLDKLQTALDKREKHIEKQIEKIEHRGKKQLQAQEKGHQSERTQLSSLLEKWKPAVQDRQQTYSSAQEHIYDRTLDLPGMER